VNTSRSRAYIHLFLKVKFGILDPNEREKYVTDGTQDGGIDGYFFDRDGKKAYFLQSKFRATETNFESKKISIDEIAMMDIGRITSGEDQDERGVEYNGKIKGLIKTLKETADIARYKYQVVLVGNVGDVNGKHLSHGLLPKSARS